MSFKCIDSLEENPKELFLRVSAILLKLIDNVLMYPRDPKYRKIRLENVSINKYVLPAIGGMECLFEIGFQEGDDSLILPDKVSIDKLKTFQQEIQKRRSKMLNPKPAATSHHEPPATRRRIGSNTFSASSSHSMSSSSAGSLPSSAGSFPSSAPLQQNKLFRQIEGHSSQVDEYENKALQEKALSLVPLARLTQDVEVKMRMVQNAAIKGGTTDELFEASLQQLIFLELLMKWFKTEFFSWVDKPKCTFCQSPSTKFMNYSNNRKEMDTHKTDRIEVFQCEICANRLLFPRYNRATQLLTSRRGRCGEWGQCFTLFCRAFGYDARLVIDQTDHVWTEVYSNFEKRWIHCDPCECVLDSPLLYEQGWNKKLSYVFAFSREEVQDVTWRYSAEHKDVLLRRTECSEPDLLQKLKELTEKKRSNLSSVRLKYLLRRQVVELAEFLVPAKVKPGEKFGGRTSGSLEWRLLRGETTTGADKTHESHVWVPTTEEVNSKVLNVSYNCSTDEYSRGSNLTKLIKCLSGWKEGLFQFNNIFRKEELDWKTVYLCRTEQSSTGSLTWKFDIKSSGLEVDTIYIVCSSVTFNRSASITLTLCGANEDKRITVEPGEDSYKTTDLRGETEISFKAELKGGEGDLAWQHAQLFRQPLLKTNDHENFLITPPFSITIMMRHKEIIYKT